MVDGRCIEVFGAIATCVQSSLIIGIEEQYLWPGNRCPYEEHIEEACETEDGKDLHGLIGRRS
jgi:hypothetical protein